MNKGELERLEKKLRQSEMDYSLKANLYLHRVAFTPCEDCPFRDESLPGPFNSDVAGNRTEMCFRRCPYEIMIWLLSKKQLKIYDKLRPPEKKQREIEMALNRGEVIQIKEVLMGVRG